MKLLKILFLFFLLAGNFTVKPAFFKAKLADAPKCAGNFNIVFAADTQLLEHRPLSGLVCSIACIVILILAGFNYRFPWVIPLCTGYLRYKYRCAKLYLILMSFVYLCRFYRVYRAARLKLSLQLLWLRYAKMYITLMLLVYVSQVYQAFRIARLKCFIKLHKLRNRYTSFKSNSSARFDLVKTASEKFTFFLNIEENFLCHEVFLQVEKCTKIPVHSQLLSLKNCVLDPRRPMSDYDFGKENTLYLSVKGLGGGGNDSDMPDDTDECVSCGDDVETLFCLECKTHRCKPCSELWHKHPKRKSHHVQAVESTSANKSVTSVSPHAHCTTSSQESNESYSDSMDLFDSIAATVDLDDAAKRCVLADRFSLTHFKEFQKKIINAVLNKKDTLVIQPTGSGKSLCFQFPAVYSNKLTLVITPTISLMQDQTHELSLKGIPSTYLGSAQCDVHAEDKVFSPNSEISVLFVSPEWLFEESGKNLSKVQKLCDDERLCLIAIDEAHLIYDWQDFRKCYQRCEEILNHTIFSGVPVMALSATVTPQVQSALTALMNNPVTEKSSMNRSNILLAAEPCNYKRSDGSKQSISLDSRDFNEFADRVKDIISDECTIVYTDFACHVAPIVLALRDRNINAVGYYGKMKEGEKIESYSKWKSGEVQVIVATRAFGLGINKPDVRFVIRNGLPPSMSAWAQEYGRAGRDGNQSYAYILYSDNDIHHIGFWARGMARQHRPNDIDDVAKQFSDGLPFSYAHLSGKCRRKILLEYFAEDVSSIQCPNYCCDVCQQEVGHLVDKKEELCLLVKAIDELGKMGEVKVTEWLRGGNTAWMKKVTKPENSVHGKSPPGLSKEWWRCFIRQCASSGYISRTIKPIKYGDTVQGAYAHLQPTEKGRSICSGDAPLLLPDTYQMLCDGKKITNGKLNNGHELGEVGINRKKRIGQGKHMLPILKDLLQKSENFVELNATNKEQYQYPGFHESHNGNVLYYVPDITKLPHYCDDDPHFLWSDIQLGKTSTSKNATAVKLNGRDLKVFYWIAKCKGVKKCAECDHVLPNASVKNNCRKHPSAKLVKCEGCPVEFVYIYPQSKEDKRRWIGGIIRSSSVQSSLNLHNHPICKSLSHKLPQKVCSDLGKTVEDNPCLTTRQLACGQGLGYRPGSADIAGTSYGRLDYHRKKAIQDSGMSSKGIQIIAEMEKIADKIDQKDRNVEGSTHISNTYQRLGRPYMRDYCISLKFSYQFIMTPLMTKLLFEAEFLETDTTYNENSELIYLFNATVFDYNTMRWAVVARMRSNKEDAEFYRKAFQLMFETCKNDHSDFEVGCTLKGVIIDWSDTEAKGLRQVVGDNVADRVLKGCNVHWTRSYQRVSERVNSGVQMSNQALAKEAFCIVAKSIMLVKKREDVLKLFDVLQGEAKLSDIKYMQLQTLTEEHYIVADHECDWSLAKNWVKWWIRPKHLQMLAKPFTKMNDKDWDRAPRNTNGVERANSLAKSGSNKPPLFAALQSLYEKDKQFTLQYIAAADNNSKISYRHSKEEERRQHASTKRKKYLSVMDKSCM